MSDRFAIEKVPGREGSDLILVLLLVLLSGIGLAALFSASYHNAVIFKDDPFYFLKKQVLFLSVGLAVFFAASRISMPWIRKTLPLFTPMDLGSILTSSASGSISRRPMEIAPRTVRS